MRPVMRSQRLDESFEEGLQAGGIDFLVFVGQALGEGVEVFLLFGFECAAGRACGRDFFGGSG